MPATCLSGYVVCKELFCRFCFFQYPCHFRPEVVSPLLQRPDDGYKASPVVRDGILHMGRQFGEDGFFDHAVNLQLFQLLVDDARTGIFEMAVQFAGTFAAFLQFVEDTRFPLPSHDFHCYCHAAINIQGNLFLYIIGCCWFTGQRYALPMTKMGIGINLSVCE